MTESTAIIDTPLSAGEVAEVVSKSRNRLFRSAAAICAGEIRGKITSAAEELEGSWLLQETTQPECAHKPSED